MSLVNTILHREAGYLYSDAGLYGPRGELKAVHRKIAILPKSRCALGLRGTGCMPQWIERHLGGYDSLAAVLEALPQYLRVIRMFLDGGIDPAYDQSVNTTEITVVGWSDDHGLPLAWGITNVDSDDPRCDGRMRGRGVPAFTPVEMEICGIAPTPAAPIEEVIGKPLRSADDVRALDPIVDSLKIAEAQRATPVDIPGIGPIHTVGGFYEMATVTAEGVTTERLRTWPDVIGEPIDPAREGREPVWAEAA